MEFRKTMDIDHILDWQPPEVSQHPPPYTPLFYRHTAQAASESLRTMSGRQQASEACGTPQAYRHLSCNNYEFFLGAYEVQA